MTGVIIVISLLLLMFLPFKLSICYFEDIRVSFLLGPVKLAVYPTKKKDKSNKVKEKKSGFESHAKAKKKSKTDPVDILEIGKLVLEFLDDFRTKLRINNLYLHVVLADEDPCDLSIRYGRSWALVGNLFPWLERYFVIKERDVEIQCDFTAKKTVVNASAVLSITIGRILTIGVYHGVKLLKKYLKNTKKSKDGAVL